MGPCTSVPYYQSMCDKEKTRGIHLEWMPNHIYIGTLLGCLSHVVSSFCICFSVLKLPASQHVSDLRWHDTFEWWMNS